MVLNSLSVNYVNTYFSVSRVGIVHRAVGVCLAHKPVKIIVYIACNIARIIGGGQNISALVIGRINNIFTVLLNNCYSLYSYNE